MPKVTLSKMINNGFQTTQDLINERHRDLKDDIEKLSLDNEDIKLRLDNKANTIDLKELANRTGKIERHIGLKI